MVIKRGGELFVFDEKKEWAFMLDAKVKVDPNSENIKSMAREVGESAHNIAKKLSQIRSRATLDRESLRDVKDKMGERWKKLSQLFATCRKGDVE